MRKKLFFFLLLFLKLNPLWADTFIVTSNADAGQGTLRDAIQKAADNGVTTGDLIIFNINDQSEAGRTITLRSELPIVTSNIIIDGTTQPGTPFGLSDARICIQHGFSNYFHSMTIRDATNVEVYGLYFFQTLFYFNSNANYALYFRKCKNLIIGKPGKGNCFIGTNTAIGNWINNVFENYTATDASDSLTVQSNFIGLNLNGTVEPGHASQTAINIRNVSNVLIGGTQPIERNYVYSQAGIIYKTDSLKGNGTLKILGNYIGVNISGAVDLNGSSDTKPTPVDISGNNSDTKVDVRNNIIGGKINLAYIDGDVFIRSNKITTTRYAADNQIGNGNYYSNALITASSGHNKVWIGGDDPADGNELIANNPASLKIGVTGNMAIQTSQQFVNAGGVEIKNNVIHCNTSMSSSISSGAMGVPIMTNSYLWVIIDSTAPGFVRGRATKKCRVDVYQDDECSACEGKQMLGSVMSDTAGKWTFFGNFNSVVVATVTNQLGHTYGFTAPYIVNSSVRVQQPTCLQSNGYIKGLTMVGGDNCEWRYNTTANFSSSVYFASTLDIDHLKPGVYWVMGKLGNTCYGWQQQFDLRNYSPKINTQLVSLTHPTCGKFNGSVTGINADFSDYCRFEWRNAAGLIVGTQKNLTNIGPGGYKFYAIDTANGGCIDSSGIYTMINQSGPTVDINNIQIKDATCSQANGSINNIVVTNTSGNVSFVWEDSTQKTVSNSLDISNIKSGKYRLKFKDAGGCDTIVTPYFTIADKGRILIDDSHKIVRASGCGLNNGSIRGILVTGAENIEWSDASSKIVSLQTDAGNLPSGNYKLTVKNAICEQSIPVINIPNTNFIPISVIKSNTIDATCDISNGGVSDIQVDKDIFNYTFRWINIASQTIVSTGLSLTGMPGGTYILDATDSNGCKKTLFTATIRQLPKPTFDSSSLQVVSDICNQLVGGIYQMEVRNLTGPTSYSWLDVNGKQVGGNKNLESVSAGYYRLQIIDHGNCILTSLPVFVKDSLVVQTSPAYNDTMIARNTPVYLNVKNFVDGNYFLFNSKSSLNYTDKNKTGNFVSAPLTSDQFFYIQYEKGSCSSERTEVSVKVVDETNVIVPNAFSPNGDGVNDELRLRITGLFTMKNWSIYNRAGQKIFSTNGTSSSWNGVYNGVVLPVGTYYYILTGYDVYRKPISMQGSILLIK